MKKRILTFGVVLVLATVLVMPGAVFANGTTVVTGEVTEGYTFTAPSAINLGSMAPSATAYTASSTADGRLDGNNDAGYTVEGIDQNTEGTAGYMLIVGEGSMADPDHKLTNKLQIGPSASPTSPLSFGDADVEQTFLDSDGITGAWIPLYVSQLVDYDDPVATGYTITIAFTVTTKT